MTVENVPRSWLAVKQQNGSRESRTTSCGRVDLPDTVIEQDLALIAPVDLGLSTRHDLEPTMQAGQTRLGVALSRRPFPASAP